MEVLPQYKTKTAPYSKPGLEPGIICPFESGADPAPSPSRTGIGIASQDAEGPLLSAVVLSVTISCTAQGCMSVSLVGETRPLVALGVNSSPLAPTPTYGGRPRDGLWCPSALPAGATIAPVPYFPDMASGMVYEFSVSLSLSFRVGHVSLS